MDLQLAGRTALVTGSSGGLGAAIVQRLAAEGCAVVVHGRQAEAAERVAAGLRDDGAEVTVVLGDLTHEGQAAHVRETAASLGVDVLVNNAGPFSEHDWNDVDPDHWITAYQGNVVSAARLVQALTPTMRERGWGRVINIGTRATVTPLTNMVEYSAAKAAVVNLTVSLAQHLAGTGITANCVSPGVMLTPSLQRMFTDRSEHSRWEDIEASVTSDYAPNPAGRLGRPDDIANAVAFLASPLADYVNGTNLRVDGGITGAT